MKEHINVLELDYSVLEHLANTDKPIEYSKGRVFSRISKEIFRHGGGYFINQVIFTCVNEQGNNIYYKFLEISYLDNQKTYTNPYEVFKEVDTKIITRYSNWIKDEE